MVRAQGMDKAFEALEVATQMVEDARPLLNQAIELVDEVLARDPHHLGVSDWMCSQCSTEFNDAVSCNGRLLGMATCEAERWRQVTPLLADLRAGNLVGNLEALTRSAAEAAEDIHRLQSEVCNEGQRRTCLHLPSGGSAYSGAPRSR